MKIAQIQMAPTADKFSSLELAAKIIEDQVPADTDLITLPEMFCCPYRVSTFADYAEPRGGQLWQLCSQLARSRHCYFSAGSMPESDEAGRIYNTAYVFDRSGEEIASHRKLHLFDIQIKNGQHFRESETLTAGNKITVFDTEFGKMGLCVCFDVRFPEVFRLMALQDARMVIVPASFNMTTGPAHWELSFRSQAVFNQFFIAGTAAAQDDHSSYRSYGHTLMVDPWGQVTGQLDEKSGVLISEIDLDMDDRIRSQLPLLENRRSDVYQVRTLD